MCIRDSGVAALMRYAALLDETNKVMNLTAITDPEAVARLHFADCLTLLTAADLKGKAVIDVGCGAGFPGVPLKLAEPTIRLTLLDSLQKRVRWLEETLSSMGAVSYTHLAELSEIPQHRALLPRQPRRLRRRPPRRAGGDA